MTTKAGFLDTCVMLADTTEPYFKGFDLPKADKQPNIMRSISLKNNQVLLDEKFYAQLPCDAYAGTITRYLFDALTYAVIEPHEKMPLLHAAMVRYEDKTILIPGISESGKSTLCFLLQYFGATLLSDELIAVDYKYLYGFARPLHLRSPSINGLINEGINIDIITKTNDGAYITTSNLQYKAPLSSLTILIPDWNDQHATTQLTRLSTATICQKLMQTCVNARNFEDHGLQRIAELARGATSGYRLSYSRAHQIKQILGNLSRTADAFKCDKKMHSIKY